MVCVWTAERGGSNRRVLSNNSIIIIIIIIAPLIVGGSSTEGEGMWLTGVGKHVAVGNHEVEECTEDYFDIAGDFPAEADSGGR